MCGIVGIWQRTTGDRVEESVLARMADAVRHRGPDDAGYYSDLDLGLGHRRLSILDLTAAGRQPMTTPDGRFTLVFNGEIYNFKELADRYCREIQLTSSSDTEVLLHVLAQRWEQALPELRGMFALALWDKAERRLLLARDPFGKKPLYYADHGGNFCFASEVKALLAVPAFDRAIDRAALTKYFLYEYVPAPATGYKHIRQLLPGTYTEVRRQSFSTHTWWQPTYTPKLSISETEAATILDEKLAQAVQRRMIADVPVGLLLSGGLDSTTIGWYMRQATTAPIHSFSVSFAEASFNEADFAQSAAKSLASEHHDVRFDVTTFRETVEALIPRMDVPLGDASLLPTYVVSALARSHITVALDGDGGDELLGGYGTFQAAQAAEKLPSLPAGVWRLLSAGAQLLPTSYKDFSFDFKVKSFLRGLPYALPHRNQVWLGSFVGQELKELLQPSWQEFTQGLMDDVDLVAEETEGLDVFDSVSLMTIHHYLANDILVKLDRASMFVSLEARTPFLDADVATYLMQLPATLKRNKYILKKLMRGRIPDAIIDRPKKGFGIPLGFWLRGPLAEWAAEVLSPAKLSAAGVLEPKVVARLLREHRRGQADHRKKLWTLLAWQLWYDAWAR